MRMKHVLLSTAASLVAASLGTVAAKAEPGLSGQVTGEGGPMEGVLVTAKKTGSANPYNEGDDEKGRYSFPARKIEGCGDNGGFPGTRFTPGRTKRHSSLKSAV